MDDPDLGRERLSELFRIGDEKIEELVKALDDPNEEVSLNAQMVIRYLANEVGLKALSEYYARQAGEYSVAGPIPTPLTDSDYSAISYCVRKNIKCLRENEIYALALDKSARSRQLLAEVIKANAKPSPETFTGRALIGIRSAHTGVLRGGKSVASLVFKNAFFLGKGMRKRSSARLLAFNGAKDKALIEVAWGGGPLATETYHVVVSKYGNGWRFSSVTLASFS
jgi:hypothetical protein